MFAARSSPAKSFFEFQYLHLMFTGCINLQLRSGNYISNQIHCWPWQYKENGEWILSKQLADSNRKTKQTKNKQKNLQGTYLYCLRSILAQHVSNPASSPPIPNPLAVVPPPQIVPSCQSPKPDILEAL